MPTSCPCNNTCLRASQPQLRSLVIRRGDERVDTDDVNKGLFNHAVMSREGNVNEVDETGSIAIDRSL